MVRGLSASGYCPRDDVVIAPPGEPAEVVVPTVPVRVQPVAARVGLAEPIRYAVGRDATDRLRRKSTPDSALPDTAGANKDLRRGLFAPEASGEVSFQAGGFPPGADQRHLPTTRSGSLRCQQSDTASTSIAPGAREGVHGVALRLVAAAADPATVNRARCRCGRAGNTHGHRP